MRINKYWIVVGTAIATFIAALVISAFAIRANQSNITDEPVTSTQPEITISEIAKHNTATNCWTYVGGMVFDATKVIAVNKAYADYLVKACGANGTTIFTVQKYAEQALDSKTITQLREQLGDYQIGFLSL